jgi:hypothetical protein
MFNAQFWNRGRTLKFVTTEIWIGQCCAFDGAPGQPDSLPTLDNRTAYQPKDPAGMRISPLIFFKTSASPLYTNIRAERAFRPEKIRGQGMNPALNIQ